MNHRTLAGLAALTLAAALGLAACGSSATSAPSAAASAASSEAASASAAEVPTAAPTESAAVATAPDINPSLQAGAAAELEAQLPSKVGDVTFTKSSFDAGKIPGAAAFSADELDPFLKSNGKNTSDVSFAMAQAVDPAAGMAAFAFALRINGIDSGALTEWAKTNIGSGTAKEVTVGGKTVLTNGEEPPTYFYVKGDTLYAVAVAMPPDLAPKILATMP